MHNPVGFDAYIGPYICKKRTAQRCVFFVATRVYKPGSVLTAIYLDLQLPTGSSRLLGTVGQTYASLHGVAPG